MLKPRTMPKNMPQIDLEIVENLKFLSFIDAIS